MPRPLVLVSKNKMGQRRADQLRANRLKNKDKVAQQQRDRIANDGGAHARRCKEWSDRNKEYHLQLQREWYQRNKPAIRAKHKQHYAANKPRYRERNDKWIAEHPERYRELVNNWSKKQRRENPIWALQMRLRHQLLDAIRRMKAGKHVSVIHLLGCTMEHFKAHIESLFKPGMSWDNIGLWHLDHIRPVAAWAPLGLNEQKEAFLWSNFQPLWASENLKKNDRLPDGTLARNLKKRLNTPSEVLSKGE